MKLNYSKPTPWVFLNFGSSQIDSDVVHETMFQNKNMYGSLQSLLVYYQFPVQDDSLEKTDT